MHSWPSVAALPVLVAIVGSLGCSSTERTSGHARVAREEHAGVSAGEGEHATGCAATVGTFNIRLDTAADGTNAWTHRIGMVVDVIGGADIWGLQEALPHQVQELERRLPHMHALWRTRDADPWCGESCPIMFDQRLWALDPDDHGTFWLSEEPSLSGSKSWDSSLPRICTYARLVRRGCEPCALYVFNVHLDHRGAVARRESARLLHERISARARPDPVVVLGDFNAGPESLPLQLLTSCDPEPPARERIEDRAATASGDTERRVRPGALGPFTDAWRAANPWAPEQGTFNGWAAEVSGPRIDFVLVSPDVKVSSASIDSAQQKGRWPSDHLPVTAHLQIGPASFSAGTEATATPSPFRAPRADER